MVDKRVLPLAVGGLAIGTTEFTIMGLLPSIADSLQVDIPTAGHLISAYALGVVVGAPLFILYSVKFPPKKVLMVLMGIFILFNGLSIVAPNYTLMLLVRFLSGLPHGAFFGIGAVVASKLAAKGKEAQYISIMFSGLTVANLAMVPLVTYVGTHFHWRWYFAIVTFIGLLTLLFLYTWLPSMEGKEESNPLQELRFLKNNQTWMVLIITAIGFGGLFTWFSYISPLMTGISGFKPENMTYIMALAGGGMVVGNLLGGYLSDKIGASKATTILLALMMVSLLAVFFFSEDKTVSLLLTFICGGLSMSTGSPLNIMLMKAAPGSEMMAAAFLQAAFNVANSAGAYLGGIPLTYGLGYNYPSLVGVFMALIGVMVGLRYMYKYDREKPARVKTIMVN
ncbi:MFS transporter [Chitinophaga caeni]|uniref:MFS transporter n=1 Tax=Chitinophaga caeni TaxID=2029983 RepID=A0A291R0H3_9BACT|nr:MFS transporter [Chitinophaga caeni]ATL49697.1 MFS transporter [Chitinophaga caeni]